MNVVVFIVSWISFLLFQTTSIYGGDAGDLVTSAYLHGVAHPPGFPLYTLLGFIASKIPVSTVAFRVGLISSLSAAGVMTVLFMFLRDITKDMKASLITVASLGTTYLFWLYASVPEVFMLHNLFVVLLPFLLFKWKETKHDTYLSYFAVALGLSLSNHLITVFLFPGLIYQIVANQKIMPKIAFQYVLRKCALFTAGLIPYLYIFASALTIPAISWDNAYTLPHFINLILRKTYGTFQSGPSFAQSFVSRLIQFPYMGEFMLADFTIVGIFLAIVGFVAQYKNRRHLWKFVFILFIFSGPFYFFYASYYIIDRFSLATFERFLLPSYIFIAIWIGEGIVACMKLLSSVAKKNITVAFYALFLILPVSLYYINVPKIAILKHDRTAENHALDILNTIPKNAVLILQYDTTLFDTQYVYYTQNNRPDVKLIHFSKLFMGQLTDQITKYYPELYLPDNTEEEFMDDFVRENAKKFPIYVNSPLPVAIKNSYWVREGLLFRFYTKETLPETTVIFTENERLWKAYSDPLAGSLGIYRNLMLSNVLDFYKDARMELGRMYEDAQMYNKALVHYKEAERLLPELPDAPYRKGIVFAKQGNCKDSEKELQQAVAINPRNPDYYFSLSQVYKNCFNDLSKAAAYEKKYQDARNASQTPVEEL